MQLREYQSRSIDMVYKWMEENSGHPCVVMPTGAGKSHIIAALCKNAIQNWPETRILMLCHQKELIEQNAEKMRLHWPGAPLGIYSASIGRKQLDEPITFAGIQSIRGKSKQIGHIDIIIIDECHMVGHKDEGGYRKLINELTEINPNLRIIGYSATPYRLGHGMITDKPALFDGLVEPVSIEELIHKGFLSKLRSKITKAKLSTEGVHKRGGEYIEAELQAAVNKADKNAAVVAEVMALAGERKAWLFFCAGVAHAEAIANELNAQGIEAACVTGSTPKVERERILQDFKAGKIRALTNANVLTTGFDYPDIDLIAMLRPTMSASLYVQMAGRGLRVKSHTDHCLVLDFAGVVETHGPITAVKPPNKVSGDGDGEAPVKVCDSCGELCAISAKECEACGAAFPEPKKKDLKLRDVDILGLDPIEMPVRAWSWKVHVSRASTKKMLAVTYYGRDLASPSVTEYLPVSHEGYAGDKAMQTFVSIARSAGLNPAELMAQTEPHGWMNSAALLVNLNGSKPPVYLKYKMDGKFCRVTNRSWHAPT
jgi:DNA repair protein RadD